ncbi:uncharacterized protein LOC127832414 [Dreissena polymorpha]|uniref:Uncharacterized protein n=1 Tax=Dreissena polymorpha TaxID=45954 RepID=A0A9D4GQS9_DREPO|nr:uncharacterized protein LOC127832414 [Dreissena polymorpha]KAH3821247.1 hypothetical protein DPMN_123009 [Dreissena polymorpha]
MTNVFTRKFHHPRTTTLLDFRDFRDWRDRPQHRMLSPTRRGNPHPLGLTRQHIPSTSTYLIWHPRPNRQLHKDPEIVQHLRQVNFTCGPMNYVDLDKRNGFLPNIRHTENTVARASYIHPARYGELAPDYSKPRVKRRPEKEVRRIVPM